MDASGVTPAASNVADLRKLLAKNKGRRNGRGHHSDLTKWLQRDPQGFLKMLSEEQPTWTQVASGLTELGLQDGHGKPLTGERVRKSWAEVQKRATIGALPNRVRRPTDININKNAESNEKNRLENKVENLNLVMSEIKSSVEGMKAEVGEQAFYWRLGKLKLRLRDINQEHKSRSSNEKVSLFVNDQLTYLSGLEAQHEDSKPPVLFAEVKESQSDPDVNQLKPGPATLPDFSKTDLPEQEVEITETQIRDAYEYFFPSVDFDSIKQKLDEFASELDIANKNKISGLISRGSFLSSMNRVENFILGVNGRAAVQRDLRESCQTEKDKILLMQIQNLNVYRSEVRERILKEVIDKRKEDMRAFLHPYRELLHEYKLG